MENKISYDYIKTLPLYRIGRMQKCRILYYKNNKIIKDDFVNYRFTDEQFSKLSIIGKLIWINPHIKTMLFLKP